MEPLAGEGRITRRDLLAGAGAGALAVSSLPAWTLAAATRRSASAALVRTLRAAVRGPVLAPGQAGFAAGRRLFNARFDGVRPAAIVYARDERDVAAAVRVAARTGRRLATRAGGHSYGGYSTAAGGILLDVSGLGAIVVRARDRRVQAGAGVQLSEVYAALARSRQTIPAGSCPTVGLAGLVLGGGVGFVSRRWGTTSDNLVALRMVTADGRVRTVDARRHPDLLWACRGGGGGNFGVATAFTLRTFPAQPAVTFTLAFDWADVLAVVRAWQDWAPDAPDDLFSICSIQTGPGRPRLRVSGHLFGATRDIAPVIAPLLAAAAPVNMVSGPKSYAQALAFWAECTEAAAAQCRRRRANPAGRIARRAHWGASHYVARPLSEDGARVIQRFVDAGASTAGLALGQILLDSYGGALNRPAPAATAFVHRGNLFSAQILAYWDAPGGRAGSVRWLRGFHAALRPHATGRAYQNYIDPGQPDWARAYYGANLARLRAVRRRYDPDRVLRFPQGV